MKNKDELINKIFEAFSSLSDVRDEYQGIKNEDNFRQWEDYHNEPCGSNFYTKKIAKIETEIRCYLKREFIDKFEPDYEKLNTKRLLALMQSYRKYTYRVPYRVATKANKEFWVKYYEERIEEIKFILRNREHINR